MNTSYLIATSFEHCTFHCRNIDLFKLYDVNVVVVLRTGKYILANVKPNERVCTVYLQQIDKVMSCDITELFY